MPDFDATDDPLHGAQEGRFFHGYYDCYCYLPLYVFCGPDLLAAKLRRANTDGSAGAEEIATELGKARDEAKATGKPARRFKDFPWTTLDSWSRLHRVVAKAEWLGDKANPHFVVTSLAPERAQARTLYEDI